MTNAITSTEGGSPDRVRALAERLGYRLPADSVSPDLIERDIVANMRRSVDAVLETGKGLLVLKASCERGDFERRMNSLGISERLGQRFMQSAIKFSKASTSTLLPKIETASKLFELLVLDDEEIVELAVTGQTGDLELDDVDRMSVSELRRAIRAERERGKATQARLNDTTEKLKAAAQNNSPAPLPGRFSPMTEKHRYACLQVEGEVDMAVASLTRITCDALAGQDEEATLRLEHAWITLHAIAARVSDLMDATRQWLGERVGEMPRRIRSEHLLTPKEAADWRQEYEDMKNRHAAREVAQEDDYMPKKRGRKKGSKNRISEA
ncbi:MAG: hypothetical protein LBF93_06640 [Zoogloeaceae bacterium]|nr:hypothetical protein [Zoogloeaceae bacterium]